MKINVDSTENTGIVTMQNYLIQGVKPTETEKLVKAETAVEAVSFYTRNTGVWDSKDWARFRYAPYLTPKIQVTKVATGDIFYYYLCAELLHIEGWPKKVLVPRKQPSSTKPLSRDLQPMEWSAKNPGWYT